MAVLLLLGPLKLLVLVTVAILLAPDFVPGTDYFFEYTPRLESMYHITGVGLGLLGLTLTNAFRRLILDSKYGSFDENE